MSKDTVNGDKEVAQPEAHQAVRRPRNILRSKFVIIPIAVVSAALIVAGGIYGFTYASTPEHIRRPAFDHYHFRTQIIVDDQAVNFSEAKFQEDTSNSTTSCSVSLNGTPIDFHDNEDQMTHIHWAGVTGGEFLKYFGWNFIGGDGGSLGQRYDFGMMNMHRVGIKGDVLPELPEGANYYVYIGNEEGYDQKDWNEFLDMDLEEFFGKQSRIGGTDTSFNILDMFTGKAYAHGDVDDEKNNDEETDKATLERINNLIGNVVVFAQDNEPSDAEIKERFSNLVPLHESTCGG